MALNERMFASEVIPPCEVQVIKRDGGKFLALITRQTLDKARQGYKLCAVGRNLQSRQPISLAPDTWVEPERLVYLGSFDKED